MNLWIAKNKKGLITFHNGRPSWSEQYGWCVPLFSTELDFFPNLNYLNSPQEIKLDNIINEIDDSLEKNENENVDDRKKAINLINAYFDGKEIAMKDPEKGVRNWVSIHNKLYWSYLSEFIKNINKYKIIEL